LIQTMACDHAAKRVKGELWRVSCEILQGIDEYEGIHKGHHTRQEIDDASLDAVVPPGGQKTRTIEKAYWYFYANKPANRILKRPCYPPRTFQNTQ